MHTSSLLTLRFATALSCLLACLCFAAPAQAQAQAQQDEAPASAPTSTKSDVRFAVLPLDRGVSTRELAGAVSTVLAHNQYNVQAPESFVALLEAQRLPAVDPDLVERFMELTQPMPQAIEDYFYGNHSNSLKTFSPLLNFAVEHPETLIVRSDHSASAYEAGVLLTRIYHDSSKSHDERDAVVSLMARAFPSHAPLARTAPKDIRDLFRAEREVLAKQGASLTLFAPEAASRDCSLSVNGLPAVAAQSFPVEAGRSYLLRADCGDPDTPTWLWTAVPGHTDLPLLDVEPASLAMQDASAPQRRRAEDLLRFALAWSQADILVGVSQRAGQKSEDDALLVRLERGQSPLWSDSTGQEVLTRTLPRLFPDYALSLEGSDSILAGPTALNDEARPSGRVGPLPALTVGAGIALLGVGSFFTVRGLQQLERVTCSEANAARDEMACQGVDGYTYDELGEDSDAQQQQLQAFATQGAVRRNLGIGLLVGGAAAVAGGALWWRAKKRDAAQVQLELAPGRAGASVEMRF